MDISMMFFTLVRMWMVFLHHTWRCAAKVFVAAHSNTAVVCLLSIDQILVLVPAACRLPVACRERERGKYLPADRSDQISIKKSKPHVLCA
ncbi:hypothetical protein F4805DRAFT_420259 [Annulohypoxylon moriforme]|nr:hypothetical protein F4805DRAFT_420259 [Annulohypoxylon moriforme]